MYLVCVFSSSPGMTSEVGELDIDHGQTATGSAICVVLLDHYFCLSHAGRQPVKMGVLWIHVRFGGDSYRKFCTCIYIYIFYIHKCIASMETKKKCIYTILNGKDRQLEQKINKPRILKK